MHEVFHILFAYLVLGFAFATLFAGPVWRKHPFSAEALRALPEPFLLSLATLGPAFLVHELMHRAVARRHGIGARFVSSPIGLALTVILASLANLLFAVPGGVVVERVEDVGLSGRIALAGPLSNLALLPVYWSLLGAGRTLARYGLLINSTLALFNMLPLEPLDGSKVRRWSPAVWLLCFGVVLLAYTQITRTLL